jgi:uncharacterized protein YdaU (DUF1376 family)
VNYYEHHIGDFVKKTGHLPALHVGIYVRFLDYCYSHESPLPVLMSEVYPIAHATTAKERDAVRKVLDKFFELSDEGWRNNRCEEEIEKFHQRAPATAQKKSNNAARQERNRMRRRALFDACREAGITPRFDTTNYQLEQLLVGAGLPIPEAAKKSDDITRYGAVTVTREEMVSPLPPPTSHKGVTAHALAVACEPNRLAEAAKVLKTAGFSAVNPGDPRFIALVGKSESFDDMALAAAEAAAKGKGWAWLLATIKGRREDAKRPQEAPKTARQRAAEATVRDWLPQLAAKP